MCSRVEVDYVISLRLDSAGTALYACVSCERLCLPACILPPRHALYICFTTWYTPQPPPTRYQPEHPPIKMSGFGYQPPSAPPAAPPAAPPLAGNVAADQHANPRVAELHTMFPTVETSVIEIILESVGGSQDRAIEQLLSMTDENFKVEAGSTARREAEVCLLFDLAFLLLVIQGLSMVKV